MIAPPVAERPLPAPGLGIKVDPSPTFSNASKVSLENVPPAFPAIDTSKAKWGYFWMFSDGSFSSVDTNALERSFVIGPAVTSHMALRGKYQDGDEPPIATRIINGSHNAVGAVSLPSVLSGKSVKEDSIHPQFRAARRGDSIYFAVVVRNRSADPSGATGSTTRSGKVLLRFPTRAFTYDHQVFPAANVTAVSGEQNHNVGVASLNGTVRTWQITNLPAGQERTFFVCLKVKTTADTPSVHLIGIDLQWDGDLVNASPYPNPYPVSTVSAVSNEKPLFTDGPTESPSVNFKGDSYTSIAINRSRDPNGMLVFPSIVPPAQSAPAHAFEYLTHIENLGEVTAVNLGANTYLSPKMDKASFNYAWPQHFRFPFPTETTLTVDTFPGGGDSIKWLFKRAFLLGVVSAANGPGGNQLHNKADFNFHIRLKPGQPLNDGDRIPAYMTVRMMNNNALGPGNANRFVVEDQEQSDPVYIHVAKPPRLAFGSILGLKVYRFLNGSDSVGTKGAALTLRVPLFKPRQYASSSGLLHRSPHLFWQFEAGFGNSTFQNSAGNKRFETKYVQVTPVQLRFIQPVYRPFLCIGASAGYSLAYAYRGLAEGRETPSPVGFGKRLEHELAFSIDLQNAVDVPCLTLGAGYKFRQNRYFGASQHYRFPFVYAQVDVVRFARRFAKVWTKIYRW